MRFVIGAVSLRPNPLDQTDRARLEFFMVGEKRKHIIRLRGRQDGLNVFTPSRQIVPGRCLKTGAKFAMDPRQRPLDHLAIGLARQSAQESQQVVDRGIPVLRQKRPERPDRLFHIDEHAPGKAVQEIEIPLRLRFEGSPRLDQPRVEPAAGNRAIEQGHPRHQIERHRDLILQFECRSAGYQFAHSIPRDPKAATIG